MGDEAGMKVRDQPWSTPHAGCVKLLLFQLFKKGNLFAWDRKSASDKTSYPRNVTESSLLRDIVILRRWDGVAAEGGCFNKLPSCFRLQQHEPGTVKQSRGCLDFAAEKAK